MLVDPERNVLGDGLIFSEREKRWFKLVGKRSMVSKPRFSDEAKKIVASWEPRPTDIIIATPPKTGTTWLQQITHQLRTGGDMDFDDIYQVSPWQLIAYDVGLDINGEQPHHKHERTGQQLFPRIFKSHQLPSACSSKAKFLVTIRNPSKVWSSAYRFFKQKEIPFLRDINDINDLKVNGLILEDMGYGAGLYEYYIEFWKLRFEKNILILCYEELLKDTKRFIPLIAMFIGLPNPDDSLTEKVLSMSTKDFMIKHVAKFDGSWCYEQLVANRTCNHPEDFRKSNRVTQAFATVNEIVEEFLRERWSETMLPATGHASYSAFAYDIWKITEQRLVDLELLMKNELDERTYEKRRS